MKIIGYAGVTMADINLYQGFFINETDELKDMAREFLTQVSSVKDYPPEGSIPAILLEAILKKHEPVAAVASLAYHQLTGGDYFVIHGRRSRNGYITRVESLPVDDVESARAMFNSLPIVLEIQNRLLAELKDHKVH